MIEGAPRNPYGQYMQLWVDAKKTVVPWEYRNFGRLTWI